MTAASDIAVNGLFGEKALITIGSRPARVMTVGQTIDGIRLLAVRGDSVLIEENGQRRSLEVGLGLGQAPGGVAESAAVAVVGADARGQYFVDGFVNNQPVRFLIDTGASTVVLPSGIAHGAGVARHDAREVSVATANGRTRASRVLLNSVRVGPISANLVEALIMEDSQLKTPLLGMSFLKRTILNNQDGRLTLSQRY